MHNFHESLLYFNIAEGIYKHTKNLKTQNSKNLNEFLEMKYKNKLLNKIQAVKIENPDKIGNQITVMYRKYNLIRLLNKLKNNLTKDYSDKPEESTKI